MRHAWYELPEFPWPAELRRASGEGSYPSGGAIQAYLRAYAARFDLLAAAQTRTRVTSVAHQPDGWRVTVAPTGGANPGKATTALFSHVVIATGAYGAPFVPPVDGAAAFKGEQLPAAQFTSAACAAGKDVVVVGAGKSALDVAAAAAQTARSVTLLARKVHWPLAPFVGGIIPYEFAAYARLAKFGRAYYTAVPLQRAIHALFSPVKWLIWRVVEVLLRLQFRLGGELSPDEPIERDVYYTGQIYPRDDFFKAVRARKVKVLKGPCRFRRRLRRRRARLWRRPQLTTSCARRCGGTVAHCQQRCHHHRHGSAGAAGCLGHGPSQGLQMVRALHPRSAWRLLLPPLLLSRMLSLDRRADEWTRSRLDLQDDGLYLYRNIAPPLVPNLLFVGGEVTTYNNPLTHALQAEWVAALIAVRACRTSCLACAAALHARLRRCACVSRRVNWRCRPPRRSCVTWSGCARGAAASSLMTRVPPNISCTATSTTTSSCATWVITRCARCAGMPRPICARVPLTPHVRQPWWTLGLAELLWPTQASDYRALVAPPAANAR